MAIAMDVSERTGRVKTRVFPNPFNPEVTLAFNLDEAAVFSVVIYDGLGRPVRKLAEEGLHPPGQFQYTWDGRGDNGQLLASGVYFLRLAIGGKSEMHKLTLIR